MAGILDVVRVLNNSEKAKKAAAAEKAAEMAKAAERAAKLKSIRQIEVEGKLYEFPADATNDEIQTVLNKKLGPTPMQQKVQQLEQENAKLKAAPQQAPVRTTADLKNKFVDDSDGIPKTIFTSDDVKPEPSTAVGVDLYAKGFERAHLNTPKSDRYTTNFTSRFDGKDYEVNVTDGVAYKGDHFLDMMLKDIEVLRDTGEVLTDTEYLIWSSVINRIKNRPNIKNTPFVITSAPFLKDIKAAGVYFNKKGLVLIHTDTLKRTGFFHTGVHEAVHVQTVEALQKDSALGDLVDILLATAKEKSPASAVAPVYGYTNKLEFAAEALSNALFYKRLKDIETPNGTVAQRFTQAIGKILGLGTMAIGTAEFAALEKIVAPAEVGTDGA